LKGQLEKKISRIERMKLTSLQIVLLVIFLLMLCGSSYGFITKSCDGFFDFVRVGGAREGFEYGQQCEECGEEIPCGCNHSKGNSSESNKNPAPIAPCPRTVEPDLSKYILKSQVPSTNSLLPDMSNYMLKTECPPVPDLSKYVLKSSIPKPQPVIIDNSKCKNDAGECPPCPRPRCPVVKCPEPTKCPPPAPCPRPVCPPSVVKCKSEEATNSSVRPFLAPLNMQNFGMA
jgi:hypothetical protein